MSGIDMTTFDKTVRPQDDFFRYVNGAWVDRTPIPADKASYGSFDILFDKTERDLRAIVEDAGKAGGAPGCSISGATPRSRHSPKAISRIRRPRRSSSIRAVSACPTATTT